MFFGKKKFNKLSMNEAAQQLQERKDIKLIDVRTTDEYRNGHIPRSKNIPLDRISSISLDKETPLFVYCQSGMRSKSACNELVNMGYTDVTNIGGIVSWSGKIERGN